MEPENQQNVRRRYVDIQNVPRGTSHILESLMKSIFTNEQWIAGIAGVVAVVVFVFMTFATKGELSEAKANLSEVRTEIKLQLDRIEDKQDKVLEQTISNTEELKHIRRK